MQFTAMMSKLKLDINKVNIIPYSYDLQPFYSGKIDAHPCNCCRFPDRHSQKRAPDAN